MTNFEKITTVESMVAVLNDPSLADIFADLACREKRSEKSEDGRECPYTPDGSKCEECIEEWLLKEVSHDVEFQPYFYCCSKEKNI